MLRFRPRLLCLMSALLAWSAASAADPMTQGAPAATWAELRGVRHAIAADVEATRLGEIHAQSERLVPLANTLLAGSKDLAPDKRARVESAVKQLPKVADALHDAADQGSSEATRRQLQRLDGLLELIRAQYSPEALTPPAASISGQDPAMHDHAHGGSAAPGHTHTERPLAAVDAPPVASLVVRAAEFSFEPRRLELRAGQPTRVELENDGAIEHALVVEAPDGAGDWIHLDARAHGKDAATFQLDRPGTYPLLCTVPGHEEFGMIGTLVVVRQ